MNLFDGTDLLETTSTEVKNRILKPGQMLRAIDTGALYYGDKDGKPTAFVGASTSSSGGVEIFDPRTSAPSPLSAVAWASTPYRPKLLIFGCSIAQQSCQYIHSPTSTAVGEQKGGTTSLVVANGAAFAPAQKIAVTLYNGRIWTTTINSIATNTLTLAEPLIGYVRAGAAIAIVTTPTVPSLDQGFGVFNAANAMIGNPAEAVSAWGYGGAICNAMLADLERDLRYYRPHLVALHLFENDLTGATGASLDQLTAWAKQSAQLCLSYGATPIVCSSMPYFNGTNGVPASRAAAFDGLLDYLCAPVSNGLSKLQIDVPGAQSLDLSTPWLDPDFVNDASWSRRPIWAAVKGADLTTAEQALSSWTAITSGGFQVYIDGVLKNITGLNFSTDTTLTQVAARIKSALGVNGLCAWEGSRFVIRGPSAITYATAASSGTDIAAKLKLTAATAASIQQGWTDGVHPSTRMRWAVGKFATPLMRKLAPAAPKIADYTISSREVALGLGSGGALAGPGTNPVSVAPKDWVVGSTGAALLSATRNADGSIKLSGSWPGVAGRNNDTVYVRYPFWVPGAWVFGSQRFRVIATVRVNSIVGIGQVYAQGQINTGEMHIGSPGIDMAFSLPSDGSPIALESPIFGLGVGATTITSWLTIAPVDAAAPANASCDIDVLSLCVVPVMPETPHSYL